MKKILLAGLIACGTIGTAFAISGSATVNNHTKAKPLTVDSIQKTATHQLDSTQNNVIDANEKFILTPSQNPNDTFIYMKNGNTSIAANHVQFDGTNITISKDIPEGEHDFAFGVCENSQENTLSLSLPEWKTEYAPPTGVEIDE